LWLQQQTLDHGQVSGLWRDRPQDSLELLIGLTAHNALRRPHSMTSPTLRPSLLNRIARVWPAPLPLVIDQDGGTSSLRG
jgi:hypothetical protein